MKKLSMLFITVLCAVLAFGCFTACGGNGDEGDTGGIKTYTMEAEYTDLDDVMGAGVSSEAGGVNMIVGDGSQADKNKGWSSGYYVGFTHSANVTITFNFNASAAGTATLIVRLGSELGNITLTPANFSIKLNGTEVTYTSMFITTSTMDVMAFSDKTVTAAAALSEGANTVTLTVLDNDFRSGQPGGPMIDCIKLKTASTLTWTALTDNPARRGAI